MNYEKLIWKDLNITTLTRLPKGERVDCGACVWSDYNPLLIGVHDRVNSPKVCVKPISKQCPKQYKISDGIIRVFGGDL